MSFPLQIRNLLFNPLLQLLLLFFCQLVVVVEVFDESPFIVLKIPSLLISRSKQVSCCLRLALPGLV